MTRFQICLLIAGIAWFGIVAFALAMLKVGSDADDQAARMYADDCPDEVEP